MEKRTMIIVWKWKDLENLSEPLDVIPVKDRPDSKVIRINEEYTAPAKTRLVELIKIHLKDSKIQLFLHERHNYNYAVAEEIFRDLPSLKAPDQFKYFLFGGGDDPIYYRWDGSGFLDHKGGFMYDFDYAITQLIGDKPHVKYVEAITCTRDEKTGISLLLPEYFDGTWNFHLTYVDPNRYMLQKQLFEFQEDLFLLLTSHRTTDEEPFPETLYPALKEDASLWARMNCILQLIREDDLPALPEKDVNELSQLKKGLKKLEDLYGKEVCQEYKKLKDRLKAHFSEPHSPKENQGNILHELQQLFEALLDKMPRMEKIY